MYVCFVLQAQRLGCEVTERDIGRHCIDELSEVAKGYTRFRLRDGNHCNIAVMLLSEGIATRLALHEHMDICLCFYFGLSRIVTIPEYEVV